MVEITREKLDETTLDEVVRRIRGGTFYQDYDWASGPALRALEAALARSALTAKHAREEALDVERASDAARRENERWHDGRAIRSPVPEQQGEAK